MARPRGGAAPRRRIGYLGPPGTFSHEALKASGGGAAELVALPTVRETILAVGDASVDRALVPIENSLEGSVNATLDTLALEQPQVSIAGETIHAVRHCLIARSQLAPAGVEEVLSHPQATGQCARFLRERLPQARVTLAPSTADAVRTVSESSGRMAALGARLAAELYGCVVLEEGVEDDDANMTRFVWITGAGSAEPAGEGPHKTSIVFWGSGDDTPGWLVGCLSELAQRDVNLTLIESRPRRQALGHYMFFADLQGHVRDPGVSEALDAVRTRTAQLRVLGCYAAAGAPT